jgi:hypothetical protein
MIKEVNGGNNSTYSKNTYLDKKAIHLHGKMEHNLAEYAKYYFYGSTKISRGSEFTRNFDYNKRYFSKHWSTNVINKLYFELGKIT